ncbi:MAG: SEL1-like repeat protein [Pseudomonadota bacterium]
MARRDTGTFAFDDTVGGLGGNTAESLFQLGLMHASGRGVTLDYVEAHKWFNLAALKGHGEAKRYRSDLAGEMSRRDVAIAQARARTWLYG